MIDRQIDRQIERKKEEATVIFVVIQASVGFKEQWFSACVCVCATKKEGKEKKRLKLKVLSDRVPHLLEPVA